MYVTLSTMEWRLCKERFGNISENPNKFQDEFIKLSLSFSLAWQDVMIVLAFCCTADKKTRTIAKAKEVSDGYSTPLENDVYKAWSDAQTRTLTRIRVVKFTGNGWSTSSLAWLEDMRRYIVKPVS